MGHYDSCREYDERFEPIATQVQSTGAINLRNESPNKFVDISTEMFREYNFGSKGFVRIDRPQWLSAGPNGHRVLDINEESYYIPSGWLSIRWKANGGLAHFVK